jgi:hypothetical protein
MRESETNPVDNEQDGVYEGRPVGWVLRLLAILVATPIVFRFGIIGVRAMVAGPSAHAVKQVATNLFYSSTIVFCLIDSMIRIEIKTLHPSLGYGFFMNGPRALLRYHAHHFPQSRKRVLYWPLLVCSAVSGFIYLSLR